MFRLQVCNLLYLPNCETIIYKEKKKQYNLVQHVYNSFLFLQRTICIKSYIILFPTKLYPEKMLTKKYKEIFYIKK